MKKGSLLQIIDILKGHEQHYANKFDNVDEMGNFLQRTIQRENQNRPITIKQVEYAVKNFT